MAYKALYRQFRPRRFSELKGQDAISTVLKNQIRSGKPSHAYLFAGPRGTGKTSSAKIMACALNCTNLQDGEPCLQCENCLAALNDTMPDIIEMDAASNNGVDEARDLRDKINLMPIKGKYKVYIIDEVHMLSQAAFNALLKTIEEPPDYAVFILATTELRKLPKTILSRCQRFDFKSVEENEIVARLEIVLAEVGTEYEPAAIDRIAEAADGGMRDALSILDKCCSIGGKITEELVSEVLNLTDAGIIRTLCGYLAAYDEKNAMLTVLKILDSGIEAITVAEQITDELRKELIEAITGEAKDTLKWSRRALLRAIEIFADVQVRMKQMARPTVLLETAIAKAMLPEAESAEDTTALRLEKMERKLAEAMAREQTVVIREVAADAPKPPRKKKTPPKVSPADREFWEKLQNEIHGKDLGIYNYVRNLTLVKNENNRLTLTAEKPSYIGFYEDWPRKDELFAMIEELTGEKYTIETVMPEDDLADIPEGVEILD